MQGISRRSVGLNKLRNKSTDEKMIGSILLCPNMLMILFQFTLTLPVLLPPSTIIRFIAFILLCFQYALLLRSTSGNSTVDWAVGLAITPQLLKGFEIYIVHSPVHAYFHRIGEGDFQKRLVSREKLAWALELVYTPRGVGWNWEVPYVCYIGTDSKRSYLATRLPRILIFSAFLGILGKWMPSSESAPITENLAFSKDLLFSSWCYAISSYLQLWLTFTIPATILVGAGLGDPGSYPYMMGPIGAMASLRCFWGRTWHQAVRRQIWTLGNLSIRKLAIKKGTNVSAYLQLLIGFFISGWTHAIAGYRASDRTRGWDPTGAFRFFLLQFCGIVVEDFVFFVLQRLRIINGGDWRKGHMDGGRQHYGRGLEWWVLNRGDMILGYASVILWFSITLPSYVEGIRLTGALG